VDLDSSYYKTMERFDARFPHGSPSLKAATSLTVGGDWTFGADVVVTGDAALEDSGAPGTIGDGTVLEG